LTIRPASRLDSSLPRAFELARHGIAEGLHPGVQIYVSRHGTEVTNAAIGEAAPGVPLATQSLMPWLSAGKPLTAAAVMRQVERGTLRLSDPVALHIPEFAVAGKEGVTIEHLLTHTAGLIPSPTGWPARRWEEMLDRICQDRLRTGWRPGEQAAYDPARSWIVLGEVLRRLDGRPVDQLVGEEISQPLGMSDSWMTLSSWQAESYGARLAAMHSGAPGELKPSQPQPAAVAAPPSPGGSFRGPARDLGRFYEMLLRQGELDGVRVLQPQTVAMMIARRRKDLFDVTFQHRIDFGLGVIVNSNRYGAETVPYGFGRYASENAFGHGGAQSSMAFADPEHQLVVVILTNGAPGEAAHQERNRELNSALYQDLGLA
jgi:CubicO group peptidase (beta-lactamase class C family)